MKSRVAWFRQNIGQTSLLAGGLALGMLLLAGCQSPAPAPQPGPVTEPATGEPQQMPQGEPAPEPELKTAGPLREGQTEAYMDRLERGLRGLLRSSAIRVMRQADEIVVVLPTGRLFAGAELTADGGDVLHAVARALRYFNHTTIRVNGYTDTRGNFDINVSRSQRFADRVHNALIRQGVAGQRLQAHGFGPTNPRVPTGDNVREPRNRRVELVIIPNP